MAILDFFRITDNQNRISSAMTERSHVDVEAGLAPLNIVTPMGWGAFALTCSREQALQVPAVARGLGIIAGTIASIPLETRLKADSTLIESPRVIHQPDPRVPGSTVYYYLVQDMKLFGVGYGQVLEVYAEFPNRIKSWTRVAPERVTPQYNALGTEVIGYQLDGKNVPLTGVNSIIAFPAGDGILSIGGRTIRTALELEKTAYNFANEPTPSMVLKSTGTNLPADRIRQLLDAWKISRQSRATAFLNADVEMTAVGFDPEKLQLNQARQYLATEVARLVGIPAWYLSADVNSMTYANVVSERRSLVDFSLRPLLKAIEQRLSMPDFTPNTQEVEFDMDDFLRGNPLERAQTLEILVRSGIMTIDEARMEEDLIR